MRIERLRLVGFKSFGDATEVEIGPGLTGIVGPNGCGKSNLVEALSWVMGESRAQRLRGGEMDDLIFAGASSRPQRDIAEVALFIDNAGRQAPPPWAEADEIEVSRRIERGGASLYRINGREVRARDVQLLFADAASGAHSVGLVTQGRVGAVIAAKPSERRQWIEAAAGVAGLGARRREAELKLNATEENLSRLEDRLAAMRGRLETLKKQGRQAERYRRLGEEIRRVEALLWRARWHSAATEKARLATALAAAETAFAEAHAHAAAAEARREEKASALPSLRAAEASAEGELRRLGGERERLEEALERLLASRLEIEKRLQDLAADRERANEALADASAALARIEAERAALLRAETEEGLEAERLHPRLREEEAALAAAEEALQKALEAAAAAEARANALANRRRELAERRARLESKAAESERQGKDLAAHLPTPEAKAAAEAALAAAKEEVRRRRASLEEAEGALSEREKADGFLLERARAAERALLQREAEADTLRSLLKSRGAASRSGSAAAALVETEVAPGFEAALGALFGDELSAPIEGGEPAAAGRFWKSLPPLAEPSALPEGVRPLTEIVTAPSALARRLAAAGLVADEATGARLQPGLAPGQILVDKNGRFWRWDGFVESAPSSAPAAQELRQKNRLRKLEGELLTLGREAREAEKAAAAGREHRLEAGEKVRRARADLSAGETALSAVTAAEAALSRQALSAEARLSALAEAAEKLAADLAEVAAAEQANAASLRDLPAPEEARSALDRVRREASALRESAAALRAARDRLAGARTARRERLSSLDLEARSWQKRQEGAQTERALYAERRAALEAEAHALAARPAAITEESARLGARIAEEGARREEARAALRGGEEAFAESLEHARAAEEALAEAREGRARATALFESAEGALSRLAEEIEERFEKAPDALAAGENTDAPAEEGALKARLERLSAARAALGPVNLATLGETAEVAAELARLEGERDELAAAIQRLRRGIRSLEEEGARRLAAAFETVNAHFQTIFTRLFAGGRAHLEMIAEEDPLAPGLEVLASPPGKRLKALTLLSGGEQALTALALLFAAFLTNPAPICVLDEVEASLDDANVARFCDLLEEVAGSVGTRFLVVTHNPLTMARVDRLYGVTMIERGVSRLVSVDLARAGAVRERPLRPDPAPRMRQSA